MPTAGWWEALWPTPGQVLDAVGLAPGMKAVDLCSGDGWFTLPMAKRARHVTAVDIDEKFLKMAHSRLAASNITDCTFVAADAYDLAKHLTQRVDFVFMANAFHGVPDKARLSRVVREVLQPGGLFAIVNWHQHPREQTTVLGEPRGPRNELRMSPEQTIDVVESADGLKLLKQIEVPPYHYAAVFTADPSQSGD